MSVIKTLNYVMDVSGRGSEVTCVLRIKITPRFMEARGEKMSEDEDSEIMYRRGRMCRWCDDRQEGYSQEPCKGVRSVGGS